MSPRNKIPKQNQGNLQFHCIFLCEDAENALDELCEWSSLIRETKKEIKEYNKIIILSPKIQQLIS